MCLFQYRINSEDSIDIYCLFLFDLFLLYIFITHKDDIYLYFVINNHISGIIGITLNCSIIYQSIYIFGVPNSSLNLFHLIHFA